MASANPHDIAYMAGYIDGSATVSKLTLRIHVLKCMLLISAIVVLYLMRSRAQWTD